MRVFLRRKLADMIDGVDLGSRRVGDVFEASAEDARLLIAEGWAIVDRRAAPRPEETRASGVSPPAAGASAAAAPAAAPAVASGKPPALN